MLYSTPPRRPAGESLFRDFSTPLAPRIRSFVDTVTRERSRSAKRSSGRARASSSCSARAAAGPRDRRSSTRRTSTSSSRMSSRMRSPDRPRPAGIALDRARRLRTQRARAELRPRSAAALSRVDVGRRHGAQPRGRCIRCGTPGASSATASAIRATSSGTSRRSTRCARCSTRGCSPATADCSQTCESIGLAPGRARAARRSSPTSSKAIGRAACAVRPRRASARAEHPRLRRRPARHPHARVGVEGACPVAGRYRGSRRRRLPQPRSTPSSSRTARAFLLRLRIELHLLTGRHQDQLYLAEQDEIAERLGYEARDGRPRRRPAHAGAVRRMRARSTRVVVELLGPRHASQAAPPLAVDPRARDVGDGCVAQGRTPRGRRGDERRRGRRGLDARLPSDRCCSGVLGRAPLARTGCTRSSAGAQAAAVVGRGAGRVPRRPRSRASAAPAPWRRWSWAGCSRR